MIGEKVGSSENLLCHGWCEQQWSVLFKCLSKIDSLKDIEGFVGCQSGAIGEWRVNETGIDEQSCGHECCAEGSDRGGQDSDGGT